MGVRFRKNPSFPRLLLNWTNPPLHVFIYVQKAIPKGDNQIHTGINTLESERHEIIACIARIVIYSQSIDLNKRSENSRVELRDMQILISEAKTVLDETYGEPNHSAPKTCHLTPETQN